MADRDRASTPLRIVVAPDSFKGSITAADAAEAIAAGVRRAFDDEDAAVVTAISYADGGEGTLDAITDAWGVAVEHVDTTDALGRPVRARLGLSPEGTTAAIEAADANGLPLVSDVALRPRDASSRGVGSLIRAAIERGATEIVLFAGGSATTDAGAGMYAALGARILDASGNPVAEGGAALVDVDRMEIDDVIIPDGVRLRVACDVDNPLVGERGAAAVFGPQKGATADDVRALDAGLRRFAEILESATGVDTRDMPGAGAAGGLAIPLVAHHGAALEPGWRLVADAVGLPDLLASADLVITGEGRFDEQSLGGKAFSGIRALTPAHVPVIVIAGSIAVDEERARAAGATAAFAIATGSKTLEELRTSVVDDLRAAGYSVARLFAAARRR